MKWMGWSWSDLRDCPDDLIPLVLDLMREESDQKRQQNQRGRR